MFYGGFTAGFRYIHGPKATILKASVHSLIRAHIWVVLLAMSAALISPHVCATPLTAVVNSPSNVQIKLEPVVNLDGFVPIDAATIPGNSNLYVGTYIANTASVRVVDPVTKTVSPTPFLTFAGTRRADRRPGSARNHV